MAQSRERVIARIRKFLNTVRSAEREGASEADKNEAASAAKEVARLMEKYGVSIEDVSDDVNVVADPKRDVYRDEIAAAVALLLGCKAISERGEVSFRGYIERAEAAKALYQAIVQGGEANQDIAAEVYAAIAHAPNGGIVDHGMAQKAWLTCFWPGFIAGVCPRLWRMKEGEKHAPSSPRVEDAAALMAAALKPMAPKVLGRIDWFKRKGFDAGKRVGERVDIEAPIAGVEKVERQFALLES